MFHLRKKVTARLSRPCPGALRCGSGGNARAAKQTDFGELAVPVAFQLAKQLKQAPRKIAAELVSGIGPIKAWRRSKSPETDTSTSVSIVADYG